MAVFEKSTVEDGGYDEIAVRDQAFAVAFATAVSISYAAVTQHYWIDWAGPIWSKSFTWQVVGIVFVAYLIFGLQTTIGLLGQLFEFRVPAMESPIFESIHKGGLFVLSVQSAVILGYFTRATGGSLVSPYSQSLLALALLSPQIAQAKETVLFMIFVVAIVFAAFADWTPTPTDSNHVIPAGLYFATLIVAVLIAMAFPLFGKSRRKPLYWSVLQRRAADA